MRRLHVYSYTVRLTEAQRRLAEGAAAGADLQMSDWVRDAIEAAARRQMRDAIGDMARSQEHRDRVRRQ
jgi:N-acetylglucosamine-6-phosphate deacetylase